VRRTRNVSIAGLGRLQRGTGTGCGDETAATDNFIGLDYGKRRTEHAPILIDGAVVEQVESFKFLDVHINNKLSWSKHTKTVMKRAQQSLFPSGE
jgi:hypothetical protein